MPTATAPTHRVSSGSTASAPLTSLYVILGILRPLAQRLTTLPPQSEAAAEAALALGAMSQAERLSATRQLARQDPKAVANVVKSWVTPNE